MPDSARNEVSTEGPLALIMAPTRELAQQIEEEAKSLSQFTDVRLLYCRGVSSAT